MLCIISGQDTTITGQLYWLFDIDQNETDRFVENTELQTDGNNLEYTAKIILQQIGIEYEYHDSKMLTGMMKEKFGLVFPKTSVFSEYARSFVYDADPISEPDKTLMQWYEQEEKMFYLMEQEIIKDRLKHGFYSDNDVDVEGFIRFSLSVQNRRKVRAGLSFENHISALFDANMISYSHTPVTENKSKPDYVFPDIKCYYNKYFNHNFLTVLGAKSTCKDRWRQVLAEADRIQRKHLITLEAAISTYQTDEMKSKKLQLVVPEPIQVTYTEKQRKQLFTVADFIKEVKQKQYRYERYWKNGQNSRRTEKS